jgi:hypothetical protein
MGLAARPGSGVGMSVESKAEINRLRRSAARLGLGIRTQPRSGTSDVRCYSLVDRETGGIVHTDLRGLGEVQERLWWIVRERRNGSIHQDRPKEASAERCPSCGTLRVAQFRWCLTCGRDYEASTKELFGDDPWRPTGGFVRPTSRPLPEGFGTGAGARARERLRTRLAHFPRPRLTLLSKGELAGGAILGLLVGLLVALVNGGSR